MCKYDIEEVKTRMQADIDYFNEARFGILADKFTDALNIIKALETEVNELKSKIQA